MDQVRLKLTKKERRELQKEELHKQLEKEKRMNMLKKVGVWLGAIVLVGGGLFWIIQESTKPLPGQAVKDLGRQHVEVGKRVEYNSNPPTSGPHYADWTRAGIYSSPVQDGYLVHSLEHGYIVISYNCMKLNSKVKGQNSKFNIVPLAYAHETGEPHEEPATPSATLSGKEWESKECKELVEKLSAIANKNRIWKLIVIPRPTLDALIALTAWTRIEKLDSVDEGRINRFIEAFRDKGPERTME